MADVRLVFSGTPVPTPGAVRLVFGESDQPAPSIPDATLSGAAQVTGLRLRIGIRTGAQVQSAAQVTGLRLRVSLQSAAVASIAARVTGLRLRIAAVYDVNVERPLVCRTSHRVQWAQPLAMARLGRMEQAQRMTAAVLSRQQQARPLSTLAGDRWQDSARLHHAALVRIQQAQAYQRTSAQSWQEARALRSAALQHAQQAQHYSRSAAVRFEEALLLRRATSSAAQQAHRLHQPVWQSGGVALMWAFAISAPTQQAVVPHPGARPDDAIEPPKPPPCYRPRLPVRLIFSDRHDASQPVRLAFACDHPEPAPPSGIVVVPTLKVYIVINHITLHRLDTGAELHAHNFSMALDYQSWTWQWSASLHHDAQPHLGRDDQGDPPVLLVSINGVPFRLRLETQSRDRRFMPTRWSVRGRGLAATLSADWAPTMGFGNSQERTAQQLANDVLTVNGVPLGWSIDWGLTDWLVPAGAWAMQGSYIDAIKDIAAAAGGYVQPHPTDAVLRILPKYPVAPWHWASDLAPDFEVPADVGETEGTDYLDKAAYNGVYVGGQGVGVFGPMRRAGTIGNVLAPPVLHPLITHADAWRQRALAELSDTGRQEIITLKMQVRPDTGVILPGKVVRYIGHDKTYLGIVRGTAIDWSRPVLRQTLRIETHA